MPITTQLKWKMAPGKGKLIISMPSREADFVLQWLAAETARARFPAGFAILYNSLVDLCRTDPNPTTNNQIYVSPNLLGTQQTSNLFVDLRSYYCPAILWEAPAPNASYQSTCRTPQTSAIASRCTRIHSICIPIVPILQDLAPTHQSN